MSSPGLIPSITTPLADGSGKVTNPWYFWLKNQFGSNNPTGNFVINGSFGTLGPITVFQGLDSDRGIGATGDIYFATDTGKIYTNVAGTWILEVPAYTGDVTSTVGGTVLTLNNVNPVSVGTFTNATITVNEKGLITLASSGTSAGAPAGLSGDVQYNFSGAFAADTGNFDYTPGIGLKISASGGVILDSANQASPGSGFNGPALLWGPAGGGGGETTGRPNIYGYNDGAASTVGIQINAQSFASLLVEATNVIAPENYVIADSGIGPTPAGAGGALIWGTGTGRPNIYGYNNLASSAIGFQLNGQSNASLTVTPDGIIVPGTYTDSTNSVGTSGQVLTSTGTGTQWGAGGITITDVGATDAIYNVLFTSADSGTVSTLDVSQSTITFKPGNVTTGDASILEIGGSSWSADQTGAQFSAPDNAGNGAFLEFLSGSSLTSGLGGMINFTAGDGASGSAGGNIQFQTGRSIGGGSSGYIYFAIGGIPSPVQALTINPSGAFGLGPSALYGTTGQVITSQGAGTPPIWAPPTVNGALPYIITNETTGFSFTLANTTCCQIITAAGTLSTGTITMQPTPVDGQVVKIGFSQAITTLTMNPNAGQTLLAPLTTITANGAAEWIYTAAASTWYRLE